MGLVLAVTVIVLALVVVSAMTWAVHAHLCEPPFGLDAPAARPPRIEIAAEPLPLSAESVLGLLEKIADERRVWPGRDLPTAVFEVDARGRVYVTATTQPTTIDYMRPNQPGIDLGPAQACIRSQKRVEWSTIHPSSRATWHCMAEPLYRHGEVVARVVAYEVAPLPTLQLVGA